jgi:hypothetical protein
MYTTCVAVSDIFVIVFVYRYGRLLMDLLSCSVMFEGDTCQLESFQIKHKFVNGLVVYQDITPMCFFQYIDKEMHEWM